MSLTHWLNTAWMLKCRPEASAFARATRHVERAQSNLLREILTRNRDAEFGRKFGFSEIASAREFQRRVPLSPHDDYREPIERIGKGALNVLTRDPITLFEPTSGTSGGGGEGGAEKLIPYNRDLRAQFQRAISAWMADLLRAYPRARLGRAYWSISPTFGAPRRTPCGIPIGFDDDTAYLGGLERRALGRILAAPPELRLVADIQAFRYCTLLALLRAPDLALISVWNPRFLVALFEPLAAWADRLGADLRAGTCRPPAPLEPRLQRALERGVRPDPARAEHVARALCSSQPTADKLAALWPRLALISCWADGAAARQLGEVRALFPSVPVQPKGLLATEGFVSFPLSGRPGAALALRSHFFEFEPAPLPGETSSAGNTSNRDEPPLLAHELEVGARYRVILTTGGGLYRYQLRDEVEIVGHENQCPLLRFVGKADQVSDMVGEKLSEPHVRESLDAALAEHGVVPKFALLVPIAEPKPYYRLYLQGRPGDPAPPAELIAAAAHRRLEANPHYRYAAGLGQLAPARVVLLDPNAESGWSVYERRLVALGRKPGDIKPTALDRSMGWEAEFEPLTMPATEAHKSSRRA